MVGSGLLTNPPPVGGGEGEGVSESSPEPPFEGVWLSVDEEESVEWEVGSSSSIIRSVFE